MHLRCCTACCNCSTRIYDTIGVKSKDLPVTRVALQANGPEGTAPSPFLRMHLVLLAIGQHSQQSAALPAGSVPNQPQVRPQAVRALRAALQQKLTPSCCDQLLQRLAPGLWAVLTTQALPHRWCELAVYGMDDLGAGTQADALRGVGHMSRGYHPPGRVCYALGESCCTQQVLT